MDIILLKRLFLVAEILAVFAVFAVSLAIRHLATPYHRGFFKDDSTIMYPYKHSTIPSYVLYLTGTIGTLALVIITEKIRIIQLRRNSAIQFWAKEVYSVLVLFAFGAAVTHLTTNIIKYSVGRLRPHFLNVCKPDFSRLNDSSGYITEDVCTGLNTNLIQEARVSFPSGHSSMAMYLGVFISLYLHKHMLWSRVVLVRPMLQLLVLSLAAMVCASRVSDYKHHWSDVMAGGTLGTAVAFYCFFCINNYFTRQTKDGTNADEEAAYYEMNSKSFPAGSVNRKENTNVQSRATVVEVSSKKISSSQCVLTDTEDG